MVSIVIWGKIDPNMTKLNCEQAATRGKPRAPFQYKDCLSRYGDSHVKDKTVSFKDKTVMRPSYL